jgi:hypothetical protein
MESSGEEKMHLEGSEVKIKSLGVVGKIYKQQSEDLFVVKYQKEVNKQKVEFYTLMKRDELLFAKYN